MGRRGGRVVVRFGKEAGWQVGVGVCRLVQLNLKGERAETVEYGQPPAVRQAVRHTAEEVGHPGPEQTPLVGVFPPGQTVVLQTSDPMVVDGHERFFDRIDYRRMRGIDQLRQGGSRWNSEANSV